MKEAKWHDNQFGGPSVFGRQLEEGDVLEADDVYDSTGRRWEPCPCPGLPIGPGGNAIWVRTGPG